MVSHKNSFLIIGGTSKGGTTSIFNYLARHPQICPSQGKETRFFLDERYPLPSRRRYEKDGSEAYLDFFRKCDERKAALKLEATPDYLYGPNTARWIHQHLPKAKLVFVLREPRSRLLSFYRFGQQLNEVPASMSFDEFVALQAEDQCENLPPGRHHPALYALAHGRYSYYLQPYLELFGREAIHVAFSEDLRDDPLAFMTELCRWTGIDASYYQSYAFETKNKSVKMRSPRLHRLYFKARENARSAIRERSWLRAALGRLGRQVNDTYRKMNVTVAEEIAVSAATEEVISAYYKYEPARLEELLRVKAPWPRWREAAALPAA
jgi:hypothetical protein